MPSGGGKSKPSGTATQTTVNPTQQAQLPFLQQGWNTATNLAANNPYSYYPGQTMANYNPFMTSGYENMINNGVVANQTLNPQLDYAVQGGMGIQNSPAAPGLSGLAYHSNPYYQGVDQSAARLNDLGTQATANPYLAMLSAVGDSAGQSNQGLDALTRTSSGEYLNSNPYLDSMFGSASDAVTRSYQSATAPQTASNFSGAGRYGSGAYAASVGQNEQNLGSTLNNLSSNIYGGNYQAERGRQDAASQSLASLLNQQNALQGSLYGAAGTQYLQGLGQAANDANASANLNLQSMGLEANAINQLQSGYQTGNQQQLSAMSMFPSLFNVGNQAQIQGGQGITGMQQAQIQDEMNRFYGNQEAPWKTNQQYLTQIGQPTTGSNSQTNPYYTNQMANMLGAATGGLGLYNGLSSAFGGGSAAGFGSFAPEMASMDALASGGGALGAAELAGGAGKGLGKMSDRRLKRDIEKIGVLPNGLSLYLYHYLWSDTPEIGLMADEVEEMRPGAVIEGPFGFKMVNYEAAVQ